jgi:hypothetical protein
VREALDPATEAKRRRRRRWIAWWSLPGFLALAIFALLAELQSASPN